MAATIKNSHSKNIPYIQSSSLSVAVDFTIMSKSNDATSRALQFSDIEVPKQVRWSWWTEGYRQDTCLLPGINCDSYTYCLPNHQREEETGHGLYSGSTVSTSGSGTPATAMPTSTITYSTHVNVSTCEPYTWHGTTYTTSGVHSVTLTSLVCGVDSVVTLHLTVNSPDATAINVTACESYDWNGVTYTESGDYEQTFSNVNGCDSVVTIHLTVHHGTHNAETETAHESYEWHGETYTETGTYTFKYENDEGCESVDTLHLTVTHCNTITLPYRESFDSLTASTVDATGVEPKCWEVYPLDGVTLNESTKPQVFYNAEFASSGNYSLRLRNRCVYAMPELSEGIEINTLTLSFSLRQPRSIYRLQVGVVNASGEFELLKEIHNASTGVEPVKVELSEYDGDGRRIAFRNVLSGSLGYDYSINYIDDVMLFVETASCEIDTLPYRNGFEGYTNATVAATGAEPDCWEVYPLDGVTLNESTKPQGVLQCGIRLIRKLLVASAQPLCMRCRSCQKG